MQAIPSPKYHTTSFLLLSGQICLASATGSHPLASQGADSARGVFMTGHVWISRAQTASPEYFEESSYSESLCAL